MYMKGRYDTTCCDALNKIVAFAYNGVIVNMKLSFKCKGVIDGSGLYSILILGTPLLFVMDSRIGLEKDDKYLLILYL